MGLTWCTVRERASESAAGRAEGSGRKANSSKRSTLETLEDGSALTSFFSTFVPLAVALLLSLAIGRVASRHGIPRVTVYLLVGLILGPQVGLAFVDSEGVLAQFLLGGDSEEPLRVLQELGVGFILFSIGAAFRFPVFREVGPRILGISAAEIGLTSVLVGVGVYVATGD